MSKNPRSDFWWKDWRNDPNLRLCSYGAKGLWMDMLSLMAESDRRGYLLIAGRPLDCGDIARLTGGTPEEVTRLIDELERHGVFTRGKDRVILNRRMVREERNRKLAVKNGKKGGNPALKKRKTVHAVSSGKQTENPPPVNPPHNGGVGSGVPPPIPQSPLTTSSSTDPPSPDSPGTNGSAPPGPAAGVIAAFDDARAKAFGEEQRRPWPYADDVVWAERWLAAGASLERLRAVFAEVMGRKRASDPDDPPSSLRYCDGAVRKALRASGRGGGQGPDPPRLDEFSEDEIRAAREKNFHEHGIWNDAWGPKPDERQADD